MERVRLAGTGLGFDRSLWDAFVALGGHRIALPEAQGGGGGVLADAVAVAVEAGRRLAPIPFVENTVALRLADALGIDLGLLPQGDGSICVAVSSPGAGAAWQATSSAAAVADAAVVVREGRAQLIALKQAGIRIVPLSNLGRLPMGRIEGSGLAQNLASVAVTSEAAQRWVAEKRLLNAAWLVGAGLEAMRLVLSHVKERRQFDRPIGSFQAIQHRLADRSTSLEGARLLVIGTSNQQLSAEDRLYTSAVALLSASDAAELAAKDAMQLFGGYGVSLEYDIHLYLRAIKAVRVLAWDERVHHDVTNSAVRCGADSPWKMRLGMTDRARATYERVGGFVGRCAPPAVLERVNESGTLHDPEIHAAFAREGWIGAAWPADVGGAEMPAEEFSLLWEALNYFGLPVDLLELTEMAAFAIVKCGSPAQQQRYLPAVRSGELTIALGYTEPDSGSDVAAAKTSATWDGEAWVIRGSKVFTTCAHVADYVFLLARTDPSVPKHRGLSLFLVELGHPQIHISPIDTFGGERTNEVFFDDVRIPASSVVGSVNDGWSVLNWALNFERSIMGSFVGQAQRLYDDLAALLAETDSFDRSTTRAALAAMNTRIESARALADHVNLLVSQGRPFDVAAAMAKLAASEVFKDLSYLALDLAGERALLSATGERQTLGARLEHAFRHAQVTTIYGGSNEIQRNIIAARGLGLPRG